jgi:hypothetical protein
VRARKHILAGFQTLENDGEEYEPEDRICLNDLFGCLFKLTITNQFERIRS